MGSPLNAGRTWANVSTTLLKTTTKYKNHWSHTWVDQLRLCSRTSLDHSPWNFLEPRNITSSSIERCNVPVSRSFQSRAFSPSYFERFPSTRPSMVICLNANKEIACFHLHDFGPADDIDTGSNDVEIAWIAGYRLTWCMPRLHSINQRVKLSAHKNYYIAASYSLNSLATEIAS